LFLLRRDGDHYEAHVYNTIGQNLCPADAFQAIDVVALAAEVGVLADISGEDAGVVSVGRSAQPESLATPQRVGIGLHVHARIAVAGVTDRLLVPEVVVDTGKPEQRAFVG
jgi:hypothetical protein